MSVLNAVGAPLHLERTYAGVLGKLIGVYLGRPVEGWPYQDIQDRFGQIRSYVHQDLGDSLIVADDDISGSFAFARAIWDHQRKPSAADFGDTWLNYIIEDQTILWWGGRGRSTEHTAYLNLADGIAAPESGSFATNGAVLPLQVGAQIFVDAIAMSAAGNVPLAVELARRAASVSHDGAAVAAAGFVAAVEAGAFLTSDLDALLDAAHGYLDGHILLQEIFENVRNWCRSNSDWRITRAQIEAQYGYRVFGGPCPIGTNFAAVLMALWHGGNDFAQAVSIAASAGWDTDSNAGVVGAINGIRLGLTAIDAASELRIPVADRMYVVSANGGSCVSDAVTETYKIAAQQALLAGESALQPLPRFNFSLPGSVQGFQVDWSDREETSDQTAPVVAGSNSGEGLLVAGNVDSFSTPTFVSDEAAQNFPTVASPTLYGNTVVTYGLVAQAELTRLSSTAEIAPYVLVQSPDGLREILGDFHAIVTGDYCFLVPDVGHDVILRFGFKVRDADPTAAGFIVKYVDWDMPERFSMRGVLLANIWDLRPAAIRTWISSARHFEPDFRYTFSVSHPRGEGLVSIGANPWRDYCVQALMVPNPSAAWGLVARQQGLTRYLAIRFTADQRAELVLRNHRAATRLASRHFSFFENEEYQVSLSVVGNRVSVIVDGEQLFDVNASELSQLEGGGIGFLVDTGTVLVDQISVQRLCPKNSDNNSEGALYAQGNY